MAVAAAPFIAQAETIEIEKPSFYGKLNVTQEFVQPENAGNYSQLNSNASRLGLKGKIALDHCNSCKKYNQEFFFSKIQNGGQYGGQHC